MLPSSSRFWVSYQNIFFDNNSSDNTESLCKERLSKIKYYNSNEDLPLSVARNIAISKCKGEYIAILDCDDLWDKNKLFAQIIKIIQIGTKK